MLGTMCENCCCDLTEEEKSTIARTVTGLYDRVNELERALTQIEKYEDSRGDYGSLYSMMVAHCALNHETKAQ